MPRPIFKGATTLVSRRCTQQQFLLLPSAMANRVFMYCLAFAAQTTGVVVHAACVMSNHYHLVVSDPHGLLPLFVQILNMYVAKCMNAHYGRWENFFASGVQTSFVRLETTDAILDKMAYTIANPVEAGLVRRSGAWPGVNLWRPGKYKVLRPQVFFDPNGAMPKSLKLEIRPIPHPEVSTIRESLELVGQAIAEREKVLRKKRKEVRGTYLGVDRVLAQKPTQTPWSKAPRRRLSPRIAVRDKWRRIEALQRLKSFCSDYRDAFERWRAGDREVEFPAGVYLMRVRHGVKVAET